MFTIEQIKQAHSKVKSGADFPAYISDIRVLGVTSYETFVSDGHTDYHGANNYTATMPARYEALVISTNSDANQFKKDLLLHQQGGSDYKTFCSDCAASGIEKWVVDIEKMTCTYFDVHGDEVLEEKIPG